MGKWKRQYVVVEPGDRNVREVAGALRASLASIEVEGVPYPEQSVTVEDGRVHWDSGERLRSTFDLLAVIASDLDVPCEWLVEVFQHEVDGSGGASLYTWMDGGLRLVEKAGPKVGVRGRLSLEMLEHRWGIDVDSVEWR